MISTYPKFVIGKFSRYFFSKGELFEDHLLEHLLDMQVLLYLMDIYLLVKLYKYLDKVLKVCADHFWGGQ